MLRQPWAELEVTQPHFMCQFINFLNTIFGLGKSLVSPQIDAKK